MSGLFDEELGGYLKAAEPGRRERAAAWSMAIGLQAVDGLETSQFLVDTAKEHIEGRITQNQARRRIRDYYEAEKESGLGDPAMEEADKVAERIAAVLNDGGFAFTPEYYISIHAKLFKGVLSTAGKIRTVNIRKHEWVLKDESVTYGDAATLKQSLVRDFIDEREFDYGGKPPARIIPHFARFIAQIWQVHPFMEGNTRTTAVFAVKYLDSLGYRVSNDAFRDNARYFRNALARANFADYARGVKRDWSWLEAFFRNLLLGEKNELKSRYMLVGLTDEDKREIRRLTEAASGNAEKRLSEKTTGRLSEKSAQRLSEKAVRKSDRKSNAQLLLALLGKEPGLTQSKMAKALRISRQGVQKHIANLKAAGRLRRVGPDKGGRWEVLA